MLLFCLPQMHSKSTPTAAATWAWLTLDKGKPLSSLQITAQFFFSSSSSSSICQWLRTKRGKNMFSLTGWMPGSVHKEMRFFPAFISPVTMCSEKPGRGLNGWRRDWSRKKSFEKWNKLTVMEGGEWWRQGGGGRQRKVKSRCFYPESQGKSSRDVWGKKLEECKLRRCVKGLFFGSFFKN